jgi:hypothetical protein
MRDDKNILVKERKETNTAKKTQESSFCFVYQTDVPQKIRSCFMQNTCPWNLRKTNDDIKENVLPSGVNRSYYLFSEIILP